MRLIIAGSRDHSVTPHQIDLALLYSGWKVTRVVSGEARGIDTSGAEWAAATGLPVDPFPYKSEAGPGGGPLRNQDMAQYGDALLAFPCSKSRGTWNMIANMKLRGKPIIVMDVETGHPIRESKWKRPNTPPALNPNERASDYVSSTAPKDKQ